MVTAEQLSRTRRLALELAGIELFERHRELLARRSRRFGLQQPADWDALLTAAEAGDNSARHQVVALITTSFTGFFRHPRHFEVAGRHLAEAMRQRGHARAWTAAVASGEEAWSLAIAVAEATHPQPPALSILATDINDAALAIARRGEYASNALEGLTDAQRARWLEPVQNGRWRVVEELKHGVEFRPLNLVTQPWPQAGPFDVILCRNVLMYLESSLRVEVLTGLADRLAPDGLLLLDPTEHPGRAEHLFTPGEGGVYTLRAPSSGKRMTRHPAPRPAG